MSVRAFLTSKIFRYQLIIALALGIVLLWVALKTLDIYTMHGKTITVPDLQGLTEQDAARIIKKHRLRYFVNDSIFDSSREKGSIASQDPAPGTEVKKSRTIYLTTIAILPEMIPMPDLIDLSSRQAISLLETYGLRIGELIYVPDIARNAVLQQKYNKGSIEPGTLIEKGTAIDLVLGSGVASTQVNVPLLIGKTREEATRLILSASLNIGNEVFLDTEDAQARVYRQSPNVLEGPQQVQMGTTVDLYYRSGATFDFEAYLREVTYLETPVLFGKTPQEARRLIENMGLVIGTETFENRVRPENARVHRQDPDILDKPAIPRGTRINIWYRSLADLDAD